MQDKSLVIPIKSNQNWVSNCENQSESSKLFLFFDTFWCFKHPRIRFYSEDGIVGEIQRSQITVHTSKFTNHEIHDWWNAKRRSDIPGALDCISRGCLDDRCPQPRSKWMRCVGDAQCFQFCLCPVSRNLSLAQFSRSPISVCSDKAPPITLWFYPNRWPLGACRMRIPTFPTNISDLLLMGSLTSEKRKTPIFV